MQEKLYIYTEDLFLLPRLKNAIKKILGKGRGPQAVFESLMKGLNESGVEYFVNHHYPPKNITACVLSGAETLKWAIKQKQKGRIKKIIAGPNIVITPNDHVGILKHSSIDKIIVPSQWVKDFYISTAPELSSKIYLWAAGVKDYGSLVNSNGHIHVLYKSGDFNLVQSAYDLAGKLNIKPSIIFYGKFKHEEYIDILEGSRLLVYVSESESQGLVLHEAWMANVPTLVWDRAFFEHQDQKLERPGISAPYLTNEAGLFFHDENDLPEKLKYMLENYGSFRPREYSLQNFTHKICAQKYLDIIKYP